jgi:hypothetical protein
LDLGLFGLKVHDLVLFWSTICDWKWGSRCLGRDLILKRVNKSDVLDEMMNVCVREEGTRENREWERVNKREKIFGESESKLDRLGYTCLHNPMHACPSYPRAPSTSPSLTPYHMALAIWPVIEPSPSDQIR